MDLLQIASWYSMILPPPSSALPEEDCDKGWTNRLPYNEDHFLEKALEDAAHLYYMAKAVSKRLDGKDPWIQRRELEKPLDSTFFFTHLWSQIPTDPVVSDEDAVGEFGLKSPSSLKAHARKFNFLRKDEKPFSRSELNILKALGKKWETAENKRRKSKSRNKAKADKKGTVNQPESESSDSNVGTMTYSWIVENLNQALKDNNIPVAPFRFFAKPEEKKQETGPLIAKKRLKKMGALTKKKK